MYLYSNSVNCIGINSPFFCLLIKSHPQIRMALRYNGLKMITHGSPGRLFRCIGRVLSMSFAQFIPFFLLWGLGASMICIFYLPVWAYLPGRPHPSGGRQISESNSPLSLNMIALPFELNVSFTLLPSCRNFFGMFRFEFVKSCHPYWA